jgi:restriction system protein
MIENNPSNVSSAFEMLLEEVEAEIDFVCDIGSKAFAKRDLDKAKEAQERADVLTAFRDKVASLRKEWNDIAVVGDSQEDEETRAERRNLGKLRKGMRTPTEAYYQPILQALDEMGGSGQTADVLDRVGQIMKGVLKDVDYQPLASSPDNLRWRNAAQWARNSMVQDGLLKSDSPRGVWEITDKGREMLRNANG